MRRRPRPPCIRRTAQLQLIDGSHGKSQYLARGRVFDAMVPGVAGVWLWINVSPFAGVPLIAAGIVMFVISIRTLVAATRLPHWDSPREGAAAEAA